MTRSATFQAPSAELAASIARCDAIVRDIGQRNWAMARAELADLERVAAARRYRGAVNGQVQAILAAALGWFAAQR
jgi:hypothetical protein